MYHGDNENGMGIGFKGIEDRDKEFIRGFVRDYSSWRYIQETSQGCMQNLGFFMGGMLNKSPLM